MHNDLFNKITGKIRGNYGQISHEIVSYVDDSTNIISCNDVNTLQTYINDFYLLLEGYYNINYLKINADKSTLLITCKPRFRQYTKDLTLQAKNYIIKQSQKIKILGVYFNTGLENTNNINNII